MCPKYIGDSLPNYFTHLLTTLDRLNIDPTLLPNYRVKTYEKLTYPPPEACLPQGPGRGISIPLYPDPTSGLTSMVVSVQIGRRISVALQLCPPLQFGPLTYQPIEWVFVSSNQSALSWCLLHLTSQLGEGCSMGFVRFVFLIQRFG